MKFFFRFRALQIMLVLSDKKRIVWTINSIPYSKCTIFISYLLFLKNQQRYFDLLGISRIVILKPQYRDFNCVIILFMFIGKKQYRSNTLKPSRSKAFLQDLRNSYILFDQFDQPYKFTVQQFNKYIWSSPPYQFIPSYPHNTEQIEQQIDRYMGHDMDEQMGHQYNGKQSNDNQNLEKRQKDGKNQQRHLHFNKGIIKYSSIKFLINSRSEQEDKQQYYQQLFGIIIDNFFGSSQNNLHKNSKVYALFLLYFFTFANSDYHKKKSLNVSPDFVAYLTKFLRQNKKESYLTYFKVAKKLFQSCFQFGIKTGLKNSILKVPNSGNHQYCQQDFATKDLQYPQFMNNLGDHISVLQKQIERYQNLRTTLMQQDTQLKNFLKATKKTDLVFPRTIGNLLNSYSNQFYKMQRR